MQSVAVRSALTGLVPQAFYSDGHRLGSGRSTGLGRGSFHAAVVEDRLLWSLGPERLAAVKAVVGARQRVWSCLWLSHGLGTAIGRGAGRIVLSIVLSSPQRLQLCGGGGGRCCRKAAGSLCGTDVQCHGCLCDLLG